jgi:hypothetical protein
MGNPSMSKRGALNWFHNVFTESGEVIDKFFIEISFKLKTKIIEEFRHALGIFGKPSLSRI